jgi:hypothetical protein
MQYRNAPTPKEIRRADAYSRFLVLYRDYPALIAPPPPGSERGQADSMSLMPGNLIDRLHFSVMNSEYVGLLDNVKLGKLFTDLEKMGSNESSFPSSPLDPFHYTQLIAHEPPLRT